MAIPGLSVFPGLTTWPGVSSGGGLLFTPPMRRQTVLLEGSLRYSYLVSSTVWKSAGVWHSRETPYEGDLVGALVLTTSGPVEVDQATADELTLAGIGTIT